MIILGHSGKTHSYQEFKRQGEVPIFLTIPYKQAYDFIPSSEYTQNFKKQNLSTLCFGALDKESDSTPHTQMGKPTEGKRFA